jgi:DNA mismatch endonuclease (patch repair protein)
LSITPRPLPRKPSCSDFSRTSLCAMPEEPGLASPVVPKPAKPYPHPTSVGRSANMKANRRTDTKPELALRRALHGKGYRYRKDLRLDLADGVRVRPDIVFTARRVAVFVDGCFWHCCPEHGSQPAANTWYWEPKLRRNVERDRAADAALDQAGWTVIRLWEHESLDAAIGAVVAAVGARRADDHDLGRSSSLFDEDRPRS